jgi:hypothetical protein
MFERAFNPSFSEQQLYKIIWPESHIDKSIIRIIMWTLAQIVSEIGFTLTGGGTKTTVKSYSILVPLWQDKISVNLNEFFLLYSGFHYHRTWVSNISQTQVETFLIHRSLSKSLKIKRYSIFLRRINTLIN